MSSTPVSPSRARQLSSGRLAELVLESAADFAIFTTDLDGIITSWNSAAERVMGWSEAEALGQHARIIFTPEERAGEVCDLEMAQARATGRARDERWHRRKDGSRFWGSGSMTRLEDDETGEHLGYCKIVRDRTEQHEAGQRLEANQVLLTNVLESNPDCLKLLDLEGRVSFMNGPGLKLMEFDGLPDVSGKPWASFWPERERSKVKAALAEASAGRVGRFQGFCPTAKGTPKYWDVQVTSVPGSEEQSGLLLASSRDVTELETMQSALRRSEDRLRTAFAISTVGVIFWGPDFGLTEVNDAFLRMTGFSREEAIGKTWQELTPPEFHPPSLKAVAEVTTIGETTPYEKQYYRRDGSRWWGLFAARRVGDEVVEFVLDVTARHEAEGALRESEARFRHMADSAPALIWMTDETGQVTFANMHYDHLFGRPAAEMLGDGWASIVLPDDLERHTAAFFAAFEARAPFRTETRVRDRDGQVRWLRCEGVPRTDDAGTFLGYTGCNVDITEARLAADELERLVAERTAELMATEETLRQSQKLEAVGQLTGGVAHDFNNLLTIIRSSADLLGRANLSEERRRRYVEAISDTANRAAKLTGQLLAFARRQPLKPEAFAVGERLQAVTDLIRPLMGARITIETPINCEGCAVQADPNQFETALVNLSVNARDAMDGEGRLTLRTWLASEVPPSRGHKGSRGEFVAVSVSDTGAGIQSEVLGRIFEPFFTTKEVGKGTGLGLSQVYGFAKQSGGELHVESEVGRGTTFTLYLPKAEARAAAPCAAGTKESILDPDRRNVLLVEDNSVVGEFARQLLTDLGYTATWAPNAQAALRILEGGPSHFDVVFSDVVMPGMSGIELGREIRRRWPNLRVVLTSGYSHVLATGGTQGFELLHKPYSAEGLSTALQAKPR
ncbi:PAS domain S-box protein [Roseomonas sp. KE2513]|uniref:hybrid sensor histidine kinase/response regulator n=1 Tax=Roseomonas sp. KE2513 TaxID=2479202 RepID=UPI0018DF2683|nr:PAS domain S-box protein [Roseomonas sp. KE2513]MBI0539602.1 PAS domain S-box protein [Roseomonas sp. KE2513]